MWVHISTNYELALADIIGRSDYSGLPLLKAIMSADKDETHQFKHLWVHSGASQADGDDVPFLFINDGVATLSGCALGGVIIRDAITQREVQQLVHTCILAFVSLRGSFLRSFSNRQ